jgi:hypothetical protein
MTIGCAWVPREMDWFSVELLDEEDAGVGEDGGRGMRRVLVVSGEMGGGDGGTGVSLVRMVTFREEQDKDGEGRFS